MNLYIVTCLYCWDFNDLLFQKCIPKSVVGGSVVDPEGWGQWWIQRGASDGGSCGSRVGSHNFLAIFFPMNQCTHSKLLPYNYIDEKV